MKRKIAPKKSTRPQTQPSNLFSAWEKVARRIRSAKAIVLFLDFDGTLVRLRRKPKDVFLGDAAGCLLRRLARHPRVTVCLISGRQLADLRRRVQVEGALYFGLHGWERSNGPSPSLPGAARLRKAMDSLQEQTSNLPGIRIEDKGICFGIHYRTAPSSAVRKAKVILDKLLSKLGPDFRLMAGKKIWEIYPQNMGSKGMAARDLLKQLPGRKLAIYAGDDTTDETAFALLRRGITIRVGKYRETHANFVLQSPKDVQRFLKMLLEILA